METKSLNRSMRQICKNIISVQKHKFGFIRIGQSVRKRITSFCRVTDFRELSSQKFYLVPKQFQVRYVSPKMGNCYNFCIIQLVKHF